MDLRFVRSTLVPLSFYYKLLHLYGLAPPPDTDPSALLRLLRQHLGLPDGDDALTWSALERDLAQRGLTSAHRAFTVTGTVRRNGSPALRCHLLAFDLDLRAIASYRTVSTLAELDPLGGYEFLGHALSDGRGEYSVTFYDWQYRRAERKKADIVVFAVDTCERTGRILGRSRLVASADYAEGLVRGLEVPLTATDGRTEYQRLTEILVPFLRESGVGLATIARNDEQLRFVASELDLELAHLRLLAEASELDPLPIEILYALGRQGLRLAWGALSQRSETELRAALARSSQGELVRAFEEREIAAFLSALRALALERVLDAPIEGQPTLDARLSVALPERNQRAAFVRAVHTFTGSDPRTFWREHLPAQPELRDQPQLVSALLLSQQLDALGGHPALTAELQGQRQVTSAEQLLDLTEQDWLDVIAKTGVPEGVPGDRPGERAQRYAEHLQGTLDAAFPTGRIARMVRQQRLPMAAPVAQAVERFLAQGNGFDFATSRVTDFEAQIRAVSGDAHEQVTGELRKLQRIYQVSPSPDALLTLLERGFGSAFDIASAPQASFLRSQGPALGGEDVAYAVHERAAHIVSRGELTASRVLESLGASGALGGSEAVEEAKGILQRHLPSYVERFGSPDLCACGHCSSVYGPAAYLVDLLRFLWKSTPNGAGQTPLDRLEQRRPDLLRLLLTCENAHTIIPYIDLANEIMEHHVVHGSLSGYAGHDTGEATADELRASPQNVALDAYKKLAAATWPFSLPYHQPLDVIRTYGARLGASRAEVMSATHPESLESIVQERLQLSAEEYGLLIDTSSPVHERYGYKDGVELELLGAVRELLARTGLAYKDLVALVQTRFLNPHVGVFELLERLSSFLSSGSASFYAKIEQIAAGTLDPAADPQLVAALDAYNNTVAAKLTPDALKSRLLGRFGDIQQVITLYEPDSKCSLDTTRLRTVKSLYDGSGASGIDAPRWGRLHRFVRLWRKLGWSLHETDLVLAALRADELTTGVVSKLAAVVALRESTRLTLPELAAFWGDLDPALYRRLFLDRSAGRADPAFAADAWGDYFTTPGQTLGAHVPTILAAFRLREADLAAILAVARVLDVDPESDVALPEPQKKLRPLVLETEPPTTAILAVLYRHALLARGLGLAVPALCQLLELLDLKPFSTWDVPLQRFVDADPAQTQAVCELAAWIQRSGLSVPVLAYILEGTPSETLILGPAATFDAAVAIRAALGAIEREHPLVPGPLTEAALSSRLAFSFEAEVVASFLKLLAGEGSFEVLAPPGLDISVPAELAGGVSYAKGSGRLTSSVVLSDKARASLVALSDVAGWEQAVEALYRTPEVWLDAHLAGMLGDPVATRVALLDRPAQDPPLELDQRWAFVYERILPGLRDNLRRQVVVQHLADLVGLGKAEMQTLLGDDLEEALQSLSLRGWDATYYADTAWSSAGLAQSDDAIDFAWGPDAFSARWQARVRAPSTGDHTWIVEVARPDDVFSLYLDGVLVLSKAASDARTQLEVTTPLDAAKLHAVRLDYAHFSQDAGIRLIWRSTAAAVVPAEAAWPRQAFEDLSARVVRYHRAAKLVSGLSLDAAELRHLRAHDAAFADLLSPTAAQLQRLRTYTSLRDVLPRTERRLVEVFDAAAKTPDPVPDSLLGLLHEATQWDLGLLKAISGQFGLKTEDLRNEGALLRVHEAMRLVKRTGLSIEALVAWATDSSDFETLHQLAQAVQSWVRSRYEPSAWIEQAPHLNDPLRERRRDALVAHLLTQKKIRDADSLFEHLLIDVQMGACMDTSRIVQAHASVQMFVQRCLLGLEEGVPPGSIDQDQWAWMKQYRLWEANRKVFLYPENWLEPEWRHDRSEFFRELEGWLVQNDITERSVEQGFRSYLSSLTEVAHLEVCGMHRDASDVLHVFARTQHNPYKYYYRRWNELRRWSPWERVSVDIRSTDSQEEGNSGVQLAPVVWKGRLLLFWLEFARQVSPPAQAQTLRAAADAPMAALQATAGLDIWLGWSEQVDGRWTPKRLSKGVLTTRHAPVSPKERHYRLNPQLYPDTNELMLVVTERGFACGLFSLSDLEATIQIVPMIYEPPAGGEGALFGRLSASGELALESVTYLKASTEHELLTLATSIDPRPTPAAPFFFSDAWRTYFVRPVPAESFEILRQPERRLPLEARRTDPPPMSPVRPPGLPEPAPSQPLRVERALRSTGVPFEARALPATLSPAPPLGLEFHTFYHPLSAKYVERLNQDGIEGLLDSDTELESDKGELFKDVYQPLFVADDVRLSKETLYQENVCFDPRGANSPYNWELFFHAPLYIATRLSKNGKFEEAMRWFHTLYDPTSEDIWQVLPFRTTLAESLEDWFRKLAPGGEDDTIAEWRQHPFDPHRVAANRPLSYMKHVLLKYVENLVAWGDSLFRQDTRESVNEALQLYVIAGHTLGARPELVPSRGAVLPQSFHSLRDQWDAFGNALVELENAFPYSSSAASGGSQAGSPLLGVGSALYFCIPPNDKLLQAWDTVADRLYKIRHCQNLDGVERKLALFAPPIDPAALIQAGARGLSVGSVLAALSSPPSFYRFSFLLQKAGELCADVKALGSALLSALEKRDAEELGRMRTSHEAQMLERMVAVRGRQVLDAKVTREGLLKSRETAAFRLKHYLDLLGIDSVTVPDAPVLAQAMTADGPLPADTLLATIATDVDESLVDSDEAGIKLIPKEKEDLDRRKTAEAAQVQAGTADGLAAILSIIPTTSTDGKPFGIGAGAMWGGPNLAAMASAHARIASITAGWLSSQAAQAATTASYIRREQEWTLQANLAAREIIGLDKQLTAADIRVQVAERELDNLRHQIEELRAVENFLKDKFTSQELYHWMQEQLLSVYQQSYQLAHAMAARAEQAARLELGSDTVPPIPYGHWDSTRQGLVAGERLQLALRQLEGAYLDQNRRELELTRSISVAQLDPLALIELRETGTCFVSLPEELFDFDFQGHYFRRIKSVRLSIPCVTGPYTSISCTLRLLSSTVRVNTSMNSSGTYEHEHDEGVWTDDPRFRESLVPVTAIATSTGQNDAGMFDFSFRDERYLPFEHAGAISRWEIALSTEAELRQFDYSTLSDVILHVSYTARESDTLREAAIMYLRRFVGAETPPTENLFSLGLRIRHDFPTEWARFLRPSDPSAKQILRLRIGKQRFPFYTQPRKIQVQELEVLVHSTGSYEASLNGETGVSLAPDEPPSLLRRTTFATALELDSEMTLALGDIDPDELKDLFLVLRYKLT